MVGQRRGRSIVLFSVIILSLCVLVSSVNAQSPSSKNAPLISIDLDDVPIVDALQTFATLLRTNIVSAKGVSGRVSMRLRDVPASQAFDSLMRSKNLFAVQRGNVIVVYPVESYIQDAEVR